MKYEKINSRFKIKIKGKYHIVKPFNGEIHPELLPNNQPQVSWSHGFTHYLDNFENSYWCGIDFFEKKAKEVK